MWQFAESIRGLGDACRALGTPVTGGNVSFYNESGGSAVYPTPIVGMVGVVEDYRLLVRSGFGRDGLTIFLLGATLPELGGSEFAEVMLGKISGRPPAVDLDAESKLHRLLHDCSREYVLDSAHDVSDGGLAVALAESAIAGGVGFTVAVPDEGLARHPMRGQAGPVEIDVSWLKDEVVHVLVRRRMAAEHRDLPSSNPALSLPLSAKQNLPLRMGRSSASTCRCVLISLARFCWRGAEGLVPSVRPGSFCWLESGAVPSLLVGSGLSWRSLD